MVAHRGTAETAGRVEVEQDGQVRADGPAGEAIGGFDERTVEATTTRLIGDRGVDKTIAEHDLARGEGRSDDLGDELSATGREEEGLSGRLGFTIKALGDYTGTLSNQGERVTLVRTETIGNTAVEVEVDAVTYRAGSRWSRKAISASRRMETKNKDEG